jgi:hypothetical protein
VSRPLRFPYTQTGPAAMPLLTIELQANDRIVDVEALLDSGASVNVLPYDIGIALGFQWEEQTVPIELSGNLRNHSARAVVVMAQVGTFPAKRLAFAWSQQEGFRPLLGQMNFFMEFNTCFFRRDGVFEILPHEE